MWTATEIDSTIVYDNEIDIAIEFDEMDAQIEKAKANNTPEPRQYSRVKLTGDSWFRQEILDDTDSNISDYNALIYLGSIPNQPGHSVYFNLKYNYIDSIHTDELEEVPEDEL